MIEEDEFRRFYEDTVRGLRAYVIRVLGDRNQADDIVQESYLRYIRSPPAGEDVRTRRAFLFRTASNLMVDYWRRRSRESSELEGWHELNQSPTPDMTLRLDMERMFMQLTPQQRQLLWLAYVEKADHRQIATMLGLRQPSVKVLLHRARNKFVKILQEKNVV